MHGIFPTMQGLLNLDLTLADRGQPALTHWLSAPRKLDLMADILTNLPYGNTFVRAVNDCPALLGL